MSEELRKSILEVLRSEEAGAAALMISKKLGRQLMEVMRVLEEMVNQGLIEKKGKTYRLKR